MRRTLAFLLTLLLLGGCAYADVKHDYNDPSVITVGLYPFVNDYDLFCSLVEDMWPEEDVRLEFLYWDGYSELPEGVDVLMYDALYTTVLAEQGWLMPLSRDDVDGYADVLPYAWQGAYHDGTLYGIPGLLCAYFLMYDRDDAALAEVDDLLSLYSVLAPRQTDQAKPLNDRDGLLIDFSSFYANLYLESWIDTYGQVSGPYAHPPIDNESAITSLHALIGMAGKRLACPAKDEYVPIETLTGWFNSGLGRAYMGFSEHMGWMPARAAELDIKPISFSPGENVPAFYTDVLSINANIQNQQKIQSCKKLINLAASEALMTRLLTGDADEPTYLLPARTSTWQTLSARYPLYARLYEAVSDEDACILRFGSELGPWMFEVYDHLESVLPFH